MCGKINTFVLWFWLAIRLAIKNSAKNELIVDRQWSLIILLCRSTHCVAPGGWKIDFYRDVTSVDISQSIASFSYARLVHARTFFVHHPMTLRVRLSTTRRARCAPWQYTHECITYMLNMYVFTMYIRIYMYNMYLLRTSSLTIYKNDLIQSRRDRQPNKVFKYDFKLFVILLFDAFYK